MAEETVINGVNGVNGATEAPLEPEPQAIITAEETPFSWL